MDFIMKREAVKAKRIGEDGKLVYRPEDRMRENAWLGAMLYPAAMVCYGWTAEKGVYWIVPVSQHVSAGIYFYFLVDTFQMIANFFYGIGSMLIFAMATTMLTEFMPKQSSNGVAVNNFVRNIFSCVGAIVAAPIIKAVGNGWLFTILGVWALLSSLTIWAMRRFGPKWREAMDRELS
jgi:predicted MFS family arabinose efflux permease